MKFDVQHEYEYDIEKVYAAFTDPDFYVAKFKAVGARNVQVVNSEFDDDGFTIVTVREVAAKAPAALKTFIGEWSTIEQSEFWQGEEGDEYYNELKIVSPGVPVNIRGVMTLSGDEVSCVNDIEMTIRCSIPLIGSKLEQFVASDAQKNLDEEYEFISSYLDAL